MHGEAPSSPNRLHRLNTKFLNREMGLVGVRENPEVLDPWCIVLSSIMGAPAVFYPARLSQLLLHQPGGRESGVLVAASNSIAAGLGHALGLVTAAPSPVLSNPSWLPRTYTPEECRSYSAAGSAGPVHMSLLDPACRNLLWQAILISTCCRSVLRSAMGQNERP